MNLNSHSDALSKVVNSLTDFYVKALHFN